MIETKEETRERILMSALALFAEQGIGKTSLDEVAHGAGVTRVTVYRYFANKKELVLQAFLRVEQVFQDGLEEAHRDPQHADWEGIMARIGDGLSALPRTDVFARVDELKRLYPDVWQAIQEVRSATLDAMFENLFAVAEQHDLLRPGLTRPVVQAIFWELLVNVFDNPRLRSFGLTDAELYQLMTDILLHGIFKN